MSDLNVAGITMICSLLFIAFMWIAAAIITKKKKDKSEG